MNGMLQGQMFSKLPPQKQQAFPGSFLGGGMYTPSMPQMPQMNKRQQMAGMMAGMGQQNPMLFNQLPQNRFFR